jgi:hypothetical protein
MSSASVKNNWWSSSKIYSLVVVLTAARLKISSILVRLTAVDLNHKSSASSLTLITTLDESL